MNAMNQMPRPLGIFWDIENCPIPLTKSASFVAKSIRDFIADKHPECRFAKEFVCVCDSKRLPDSVFNGLHRNGVTVVHVNSTAKNAADDKLQELIDGFIDTIGDKCPVVVIISGDINFGKSIRNARSHTRSVVEVVLIHGSSCSQELKGLANESYLFEDIIENVGKQTINTIELKPTYLKVSNLPKDKPIKDIISRLSKLSDNCGGKPENLFDGKALIRFGCKDDAQRALQRMTGEDCFGLGFELQLIESELKFSTEVQDFNICKSVLRGYEFESQQNLTKNVQKLVTDWNDSEINDNIIVSVEVLENKDLIVTAVSPEANQKLLSSAKRHLKGGIEWNELKSYDCAYGLGLGWISHRCQSVPDDCKSVIKGLETRKGQNFTEIVKNLVNEWNDSQIDGNCIVCVERNSKQTQSDGKINLFVTAISAEASKGLVKCAKRCINESDGIKWIPYKSRLQSLNEDNPQNCVSDDCKSVIKGLNTRRGDNFTELVQKIVNDWNDSKIKSDFITDVERNSKQTESEGKINLFVTATSAQTCRALVMGAQKYIKSEHKIKWTHYRPRSESTTTEDTYDSDDSYCSFYSTSSSVMENTKNRSQSPHNSSKASINSVSIRLSVIEGLETKADQNVAKIVRKLVMDWEDKAINGNFIAEVERHRSYKEMDGKIKLFVTAISGQACHALVKGAQKYLKPNDGIIWSYYNSNEHKNQKSAQEKPRVLAQSARRETNGSPLYYRNLNTIQKPLMNLSNNYWNRNPNPQNLSPFRPHMSPFFPNLNPFLFSLYPIQSNNNPFPPNISPFQSTPTAATVQSTAANNSGYIKAVSDVNDDRKSVIDGLHTTADENVTKSIRKLIMKWNDKTINGNCIVEVERDPKYAKIDGKISLIAIATCAHKCRALVNGAHKYLKPSDGIVWTVYKSEDSRTVGQVFHPNQMLVICGHYTRHTDDVLVLVRNLILSFKDSRLCAEDIISVSRDHKWKSRDGTAMLFITTKDPNKKQLILDYGNRLNPKSKIQFKDYNGFKH